jgi:hypothetical protein
MPLTPFQAEVLAAVVACISLSGCGEKRVPMQSSWYEQWIERDLNSGSAFHSEFALKAGEIKWVEFKSTKSVSFGLVVKDGYEVTKAGGLIYMGTATDIHKASGSPGFANGVIRARIENGTTIDTRAALVTKSQPPEQ